MEYGLYEGSTSHYPLYSLGCIIFYINVREINEQLKRYDTTEKLCNPFSIVRYFGYAVQQLKIAFIKINYIFALIFTLN